MFQKILIAILVIAVALMIIGWAVRTSPASPSEISAVVKKAAGAPDSKALAPEFLSVHANPSVGELKDFERRVDQILVRDISRKTTGDMSIKAPYELEELESKQRDIETRALQDSVTFSVDGHKINLLQLLTPLGIFLIAIFGVIKFSRSYTSNI